MRLQKLLIFGCIGAAACLTAIGLRFLGALEPVELFIADAFMQLRAETPQDGGPHAITLVLMTEEDVANRGWPLSDGVLAEALEAAAAMDPVVIGVDIYRDRPVGDGAAVLDALLRGDERIVWVTKFGIAPEAAVPPPAPLIDTARRGFADMVIDDDGVIRRALLFLDDGETFETSLALAVATPYLAARGVGLAGSKEDPSVLALGDVALPPFDRDEGPYRGADDGGYQIPLDFARGVDVANQTTLSEVLSGEVDRSLFEGRIVLFGSAAETVKDSFLTPFSEDDGDAYGVAVHAVIVDQLLRHGLQGASRQRAAPWGADELVIFAAAMLGAAAASTTRAPVRFAGAVFALAGAHFAVTYAAFASFIWPPAAPAAFASLLAAGGGGVYAAWSQSAERRNLMSLFSRHVSGAVAERIWRDRSAFLSGGAPKPQRLTATVLFSDIRGFTPISEALGEEALMTWLNEYMEEMADAVLSNGGVIDKYIGDAIMAVWGAPTPSLAEADRDRDARAAARCALAMAAQLETLNARNDAAGLPRVAMRIGLHTGPLVAGSLGAKKRLEYTVIGDTVNVAARLESAANRIFEAAEAEGRATSAAIAVSGATHSRLGGAFEASPLGALALKGKADGVEAFALVAEAKGEFKL